MKILFYKAWVAGDFKDKVISIWTFGPYSHVELMFSDDVCFSASWRGNEAGVRFKKIHVIPERWDIIEIPTTIAQEAKIRGWCEDRAKENAKYDWWGIVQFVLPFVQQKDEDWYCSEISIAALNYGGVLNWTTFMSPNFFYRELKKLPL